MNKVQIIGYENQIIRSIIDTGRFEFDFQASITYRFAVVRDFYRRGIIDRSFEDFGMIITFAQGWNWEAQHLPREQRPKTVLQKT